MDATITAERGLTRRQAEVLIFIAGWRRGVASLLRSDDDVTLSPTCDEISEYFGITKQTVHHHLLALHHKGAIESIAGLGKTRRWRIAPKKR